VYGTGWIKRYGLVDSNADFDLWHMYFLGFETGMAILTGTNMSVMPGTRVERFSLSVGTAFAFLLGAWVVASFVEDINVIIRAKAERRKRHQYIDEYCCKHGISSRQVTSMNYFLSARYQDILQARRFPETHAMFNELPANLRKILFTESYTQVMRAHPFFCTLSDACMADLCFGVEVSAYVRGDLVRKERQFKLAGDKSAVDWQTEGIRFVLQGCLHSGWNVGVLIHAPGFFDEERFFSLHFSCTPAATDLYATQYTEVVLLAREVAIRTFARYPLHYNDYVQEVIGMRWYTFTKALLTRLNSKLLLNGYVHSNQPARRLSTWSTAEPEPPAYATGDPPPPPPASVEEIKFPWTPASPASLASPSRFHGKLEPLNHAAIP
jgi:hypothetical protein